ncbi:hypothetical protein RvY_18208 [Ramazzottius varieornatus]|uniref:Uncharacterized protein n=1 Tax=Ramazzottius varieornatus TaxID=947166 RepID=A0A1D1W6N1_RAMVA|nr:hypothetical protein RvY_18208 [Ramazzottius varieornatus]
MKARVASQRHRQQCHSGSTNIPQRWSTTSNQTLNFGTFGQDVQFLGVTEEASLKSQEIPHRQTRYPRGGSPEGPPRTSTTAAPSVTRHRRSPLQPAGTIALPTTPLAGTNHGYTRKDADGKTMRNPFARSDEHDGDRMSEWDKAENEEKRCETEKLFKDIEDHNKEIEERHQYEDQLEQESRRQLSQVR